MATKKTTERSIDEIVVPLRHGAAITAKNYHNSTDKGLLAWTDAWTFLASGVPVKRLAWMGYWQIEKGKLVMHCKDGKLVTLADCDNPFTLDNIAHNDWVPLTQSMKDSLDAIHAAKILTYKKEG